MQVFYSGPSLILLPLLHARFQGVNGVCGRKFGLGLTNARSNIRHCEDQEEIFQGYLMAL
jgi:hypothetical protein